MAFSLVFFFELDQCFQIEICRYQHIILSLHNCCRSSSTIWISPFNRSQIFKP